MILRGDFLFSISKSANAELTQNVDQEHHQQGQSDSIHEQLYRERVRKGRLKRQIRVRAVLLIGAHPR